MDGTVVWLSNAQDCYGSQHIVGVGDGQRTGTVSDSEGFAEDGVGGSRCGAWLPLTGSGPAQACRRDGHIKRVLAVYGVPTGDGG